MAQGLQLSRAYGFNGYVNVFPLPIVTTVAPVNGVDTGLSGQVWINTATSTAYIMANPFNSTWVTTSAGNGTFANLTVTPGPTTLTGALTVNSAGNAINIATDNAASAITIGNITGGTSLTLNTGTGAANIASSATVHATIVGSLTGASVTTIRGGNVGGGGLVLTAATGGAINIGNDVSNNAISIGNNNGVGTQKVIAIGSTSATSTLNLFAPSGAVAGVNGGIGNSNGTQEAGWYVGTGAPGFTAAKGSFYINTIATTTTTRMYINTDAGTTWANFTTSL